MIEYLKHNARGASKMSAKAILKTVGQVIADCGIRQRSLADMLGVTEGTISRYVSGVRAPSPEVLDRIAKITNHKLVLNGNVFGFRATRRK